ncbi:hypothetical protein JZ751_009157 [Albula glossodonta]|uniref:Uncharacterized protein n=1 Tax=Albula glossodonta TaxID=121402 RepID=A0A8T2N0W6_9TELE|nr:hypothetical protein JZ751_009157 [Albula glossodonta]
MLCGALVSLSVLAPSWREADVFLPPIAGPPGVIVTGAGDDMTVGRSRPGWGAEGGEVSHQEAVILCTASQTGPVRHGERCAPCRPDKSTEKSQIPVYISTVDMRDWIISKAQSIPRERCVKLQDLSMTPSRATPSCPERPGDPAGRCLSDLYAPPMRFICLATAVFVFSSFYFDLQPVVERAVREIIEELAQPPTSPLQTVAEVVMDTFADPSCALLEGGEELSGRLLSDMAVAVTVSMLQELEGVEQCEVQCWRQVRPRLVGALCGELLETVSPKDLQRALRGKWDAESRAVTAAIITSVTAAVNSVLAQPDATPGSSLETAVDADEEAKDVETMLVDVAAPSIQMETAADAAAEAAAAAH